MKMFTSIRKILTCLLISFNLYSQDRIISEVDLLISERKFEEAENILITEINKKESTELIEILGDIYGYQKEWEKAEIEYQKIIKMNPDNANYYFKYGGALGMLALENKMKGLVLVNDIEQAFLKTVELDSKHLEVRWALVEFYIQLPGILGGSYKKANEYADQLGKIKIIEGLLAKSYIADYRKIENEAEKFSRKAMEYIDTVNEDYPRNNINYQIGKTAANYNINLEDGIKHLNRYIKNYSLTDNVSLHWIYLQLARIYKLKYDKNKALISIEKALEIKPDFKWAIKIKGEIEAM